MDLLNQSWPNISRSEIARRNKQIDTPDMRLISSALANMLVAVHAATNNTWARWIEMMSCHLPGPGRQPKVGVQCDPGRPPELRTTYV